MSIFLTYLWFPFIISMVVYFVFIGYKAILISLDNAVIKASHKHSNTKEQVSASEKKEESHNRNKEGYNLFTNSDRDVQSKRPESSETINYENDYFVNTQNPYEDLEKSKDWDDANKLLEERKKILTAMSYRVKQSDEDLKNAILDLEIALRAGKAISGGPEKSEEQANDAV